jgi:hypothetical protein
MQASGVTRAAAAALDGTAAALRGKASHLSTVAGYRRRAADWTFQVRSAERELAAIEKQIAGAEIRLDVARQELRNHDLQIRHSAEVREWMERKFTNQDLYDWMVGQLAAIHFQTWQVAYAAAKKAEACYNHELGRTDAFVQAVHWDGTRRGLLAGERLAHDLERMDIAYLDHDVREHELTRHVSLFQHDPFAVERLKADGFCYFNLPEALFDLDCATHAFRRLQSVALSVPCVSGPQGALTFRLTLHSARIRGIGGDLTSDEGTGLPSIVTSSGTQDSGLFQTDLRDPRYLPFERRGAVSTWMAEIVSSTDLKQFDWSTIDDIVMSVRYTAREGGSHDAVDALSIGVDGDGAGMSNGFARVISARRDAPDALAVAQDEDLSDLTLVLGADQIAPAGDLTLDQVLYVPVPKSGVDLSSATVNGQALMAFSEGVLRYAVAGSLPSVPGDHEVTLAGVTYADLDDLLVVLVFGLPA